jgi:hypothetical protein
MVLLRIVSEPLPAASIPPPDAYDAYLEVSMALFPAIVL